MPIHVIFQSYPQPNGPAFYTGAGFLTKEALVNTLLAEFERTEMPNFCCFIAREFELPKEQEKFS
jgi:hypothetical protein